MNICCIDDNVFYLEELIDKIQIFFDSKHLPVHISKCTTIPLEVLPNIDIYFLDIEIAGETIFNFAEKINKLSPLSILTFVSNFDSYIFNSVKLETFDYIRKRKLDDELPITLARALKFFRTLSPIYIAFKENNMTTAINIKDIAYVEAYSHNCIIHALNHTYYLSKGVKEIFNENLTLLSQIHKSYYVNPKYIQSISSTYLIMHKSDILPIGRKYRIRIKEDYFNSL